MTNSNSSNLILFPDFASLQSEVERQRTEMSMLLLERDNLLLVECRNLEMAYMLALGDLEYQVYEASIRLSRLRRKLEMIQARVNRQEQVVLRDIEEVLDQEFADYQRALDAEIERMNEALERKNLEAMSESDARELKKLYREIVKALHPDLHPDISEARLGLFQNAISAYEAGDLSAIRIIAAMLSEQDLPEEGRDSMGLLAKEKERLSGLLGSLVESIAAIKGDYPYSMKGLLQDEEALSAKRAELEESLATFQEAGASYEARIENLLG